MTFPDAEVRIAAFNWLDSQVQIYGEVLPRAIIQKGFEHKGARVPLVGPQGIFIPAATGKIPLSITTSPDSKYSDRIEGEELLVYSYRGTDPMHRENVGLREAMRERIPLVYFHGIKKGAYLAVWPMFIVGDDPKALEFSVAADDRAFLGRWKEAVLYGEYAPEPASPEQRKYVMRSVRTRVHQKTFRAKVLDAYKSQCAMCRLKHENLLDAAHIIPDSDERGVPEVYNGLSLCKIHHAAFDAHILGIRPDYVVEVRKDILDEVDGPMLKHGLQALQDSKLWVPRKAEQKPRADFLESRYEAFRAK